jgi:molecular chaperone DnaK
LSKGVREVERESGIRVENDPMVLARVAEAYLRALGELRTEPATEINLPFLAANERGPHHFARRVTPAILAAYAEGRIQLKEVPPTTVPEAKAEPKKKRWWQL